MVILSVKLILCPIPALQRPLMPTTLKTKRFQTCLAILVSDVSSSLPRMTTLRSHPRNSHISCNHQFNGWKSSFKALLYTGVCVCVRGLFRVGVHVLSEVSKSLTTPHKKGLCVNLQPTANHRETTGTLSFITALFIMEFQHSLPKSTKNKT